MTGAAIEATVRRPAADAGADMVFLNALASEADIEKAAAGRAEFPAPARGPAGPMNPGSRARLTGVRDSITAEDPVRLTITPGSSSDDPRVRP